MQTTPWDEIAEEYHRRWIALNRPLFERTIALLPELDVEGPVHVPGVGPGSELPLLAGRYPDRIIEASDPAEEMLALVRRAIAGSPLEGRVRLLRRDLFDPASASAALSCSLFLVHFLRDPVAGGLAQWSTVRPGGWLAALYFPPLPVGEGPLAALWEAARRLRPREAARWEPALRKALENAGAGEVRFVDLPATWRFTTPGDFRRAMELLPHFAAVRRNLGEETVEQLWGLWEERPGLNPRDSAWEGPVTARLLLAHKRPGGAPDNRGGTR